MSEVKSPPHTSFFVHPSAIVDEGVLIGEGTKIWHFSHVQSGVTIGRGCNLGQNVNVGRNVVIGDGVKIQNNVSVYEGVELHDFVFCGPSAVFTNVLLPRSEFPQPNAAAYLKTVVETGASLGANCTVVCGHTLGKYCMIGAGAVVTHDVPPYCLVVGNPARFHGWVCRCGKRLASPSEERDSHGARSLTSCESCGRSYVVVGGALEAVQPNVAPPP